MAKRLRCKDVFEGCYFEVTGQSEAEIMEKAAAHAVGAHGVTQITVELSNKIRAAIQDA